MAVKKTKTTKAASRPTPGQVMDVMHPPRRPRVASAPASDSPTLIVKRSLAVSDPSSTDAAKTATQPASQPVETMATAPVINRQARTIMPLGQAEETPAEDGSEKITVTKTSPKAEGSMLASPELPIEDLVAQIDAETPEPSDAEEEKPPVPDTSEPTEEVSDSSEPEVAEQDDESDDASVANEEQKPVETATSPGEVAASPETPSAPEDDSTVPDPEPPAERPATVETEDGDDDEDDTDEDAESTDTMDQEKTAEQRRNEELESHITKGTYAVPINRSGKHRIHMLILLVFVVLIAILMVNLLFDMDIIESPGIPHTDFFALLR